MLYVIIIVLTIFLLYFCLRYLSLKRAVRSTKEQLDEIILDIEENRIVRLIQPEKSAEDLQKSINEALREVRAERADFTRKEKAFKQQIENISHDLRTPLTSILGYLRIIDQNNMDTEDQNNFQIVQRKAETLQKLITQFYDFSRLTAEDYKIEIDRMDIVRLLRETLADSYTELSAGNVEVKAELPEIPVWTAGDENAMLRVFQNLLQNAGRYAKSRLLINMEITEEEVRIFFRNDTDGMDERTAEKLSDRFYTADSSRGNGSTGLGLTIAKELMNKMNGNLTVAATSNGWLEFCVLAARM